MEKGYVIKGFGASDPLPNNLYFKEGENMTWIATFPDLHKAKDYLEYLNSKVLEKGFVAVKAEDLERWSRRLFLNESYCNKDIVKVNKEMKKYLSEEK